MFVPGRPFQPSLMFMGKARLERLARDKQSSLLRKMVNNGWKKLYTIVPKGNMKKIT
jgi:hypothetical protein